MANFYGNLITGRLHISQYADKRCEIRKEKNKIEFDTYEEAITYPSEEEPIFTECANCFPKMRKAKKKK